MFISRSSLPLVYFLTAPFIFTGAPAIVAQLPPGRLLPNSPPALRVAQASQGRLFYCHASARGVEGLLPQLTEAGNLFDRALELYKQGEGDAAIPLLERFLEIVRKAPGNHASDVAKALTFLGQIYTDKEDFAKAEVTLLRAVQVIERGGGTNHQDYPAALQRLATLYAEMGALPSAEKALGRAMETWEKLPGDHHSDQAELLNRLGLVYQWRGEYSRAEQTFNRGS